MIWYILLAAGVLAALWAAFAAWYLWDVSRVEGARVERDRKGRIIAIITADTRKGLDGESYKPRRYR